MRKKNKSKRLLRSLMTAASLLIVLGVLGVAASRPAMPAEWKRITSGMPREDPLALLTDEVKDFRELKGFDVVGRTVPVLGGHGYWVLMITYDESGKATSARAQFTHESVGLFNSTRIIL